MNRRRLLFCRTRLLRRTRLGRVGCACCRRRRRCRHIGITHGAQPVVDVLLDRVLHEEVTHAHAARLAEPKRAADGLQ